VDYFGREKLRELLERPAGTAVSIYLPTTPSSSEAEGDRLRFRAALDQARQTLASDGSDEATLDELEELVPLTRDQEFWRYQAEGLAVFLAPGVQRLYRVPTDLPELVVVGPTFHTRPLLEYLQAPDRYWVLGLGRKEVRMWEGTGSGVVPMDFTGLPRSLLDALGLEFERDYEIVHRRKAGPSRGERGRGGHQPTCHGHGVGHDDAEPELRQFFRRVDRGVGELLKGEAGPVVLAAVQEYHPLYRDVSSLENLAPEGIQASVTRWPPDRIHEEAWPIARRAALERLDEALELWETSYGRGKGEADVANLCHLAVAGRIRLLLTERERRVWGTLDRDTGAVEILREGGDDPGEHAVELLDELAELVILRGGDALSMSADRMPTGTGAAGILR
jgi:hypothetical protein